jgi:hypothetical protein
MVDARSHLSQEERRQRQKRLEQARRRARQKPERGRAASVGQDATFTEAGSSSEMPRHVRSGHVLPFRAEVPLRS